MGKYANDRVKGFLHADGTRMVNGDGETVVLRSYGVGNWMNPEGFMIGGSPLFGAGHNLGDFILPGRFEKGRSMKSAIRELCGTEYADYFEDKWIENYFTEADVALMEELGFNAVRLPVSARLFLAEEPGIHFIEKNFQVLDRVFEWCGKHHIYGILDLHGAVGGQSALPCDDGIDSRPHTFTEPESRERTMLLWEEFARRYKECEACGGYDLLNEPLSGPGSQKLMPELVSFYDEVIARIRKIDKNHMFTIEGMSFSGDLDIFDHDYDPECHNWCIHTHFYRFSPEAKDLYRMMEPMIRLNVPLWIGEGGSAPVDNTVYYEIAGHYNIGYGLWSWKSAMGEMPVRTVGYPLPEGWKQMQEFFSNGGPRPSYEDSKKMFDEMLESIRLENCTVNRDAFMQTLRQPGTHTIVPAVGFDEELGSYRAAEYLPDGADSPVKCWPYGNAFAYRTETFMKMPLRNGKKPPKMMMPMLRQAPPEPLKDLCLELSAGEFVTYTIRNVRKECEVKVEIERVTPAGVLQISAVNEKDVSVTEDLAFEEGTAEAVAASGNPDTSMEVSVFPLIQGEEWKVRVECVEGAVRIDALVFAGE